MCSWFRQRTHSIKHVSAMASEIDGAASPLRFRRRPIHFGVSAAVVALEAVPGFAPGIGQRDEGDGGVVEGTGRLFVEEVHLGHHRD